MVRKKQNNNKRWMIFICLVLISVLLHSDQQNKKVQDVKDLSFTDLLNVKVVVAGKTTQTISASPSIVSVLNAEDIKQLGVINLVDVFSYIPGFTVTDNYWTREMVTAREVFQALYNDKILLLIDGIPAYEAVNTEYYLDLIPIEAVERVEIIRGPESTLYGTNAFAGVINIVTLRGKALEKMEFKATAGANSLFEKTITIGRKVKDLDIFFSGNIREDKGYSYLIPFDEAGNRNFPQSYRKEFNRGHLRLEWKEFALSIQMLEYSFDHFGMTPNLIHQGSAKHYTTNVTFSFTKTINSKLSTQNSFRIMRQVRDNEAGNFLAGLPRVDGQISSAPTFINWQSIIYQFETQWNFKASKQLSFVGGFSAERRDPYDITTMYDQWGLHEETRLVGGEGCYVYPPEKNVADYGVYIQGDWRVKKVGVVGGIRYTHMGVVDKELVAPSAALVFDITSKLHAKVLYGIAFRSPTIYETEVFVKNVLYGKDSIDPEKVSAIELGLDYTGKKISTRANYYTMTIDDIIARRALTNDEKASLEATAGVIYDNINNQKLNGFEMEVKAYPFKNLNFFANGSVRTGKDRATGKELNYLAKTLFSAGCNVKIPLLNMNISPNFYSVSKREGVALDGKTYIFPSYFIMNLRVAWEISKQITLELIGKNLGNKMYYYPEMTRNRKGLQLPGNIPRAFFFRISYHINL